jgi:hypothetical protein
MLYHLGWNENGDRLDVAVALNRMLAAGTTCHRLPKCAGHAEAGDYLVDIVPAVAEEFARHGLALRPWTEVVPPDALRLRPVKIAMLAGKASAYPYYGYYALALSRLGYAFRSVSGPDIANGALEGENLLILPGGFSNWSLDAKEETSGADAAVRGFFRRGGVAVTSCGGTAYLSRGRPTWLGVADARPRITQDYLRTGVGMTTCRIAEGWLRLGLPPTLELPYFHGPVFDEIGENCTALATFRDLNAIGRLFIDNPLTEATFDSQMRDRIAILRASGPRGRALMFSPHPEMGDLLAKYMTLESYVPKYLPIRGVQVMRETLDTYRPEESRSFVLILNAIEEMAREARPVTKGASGKTATVLETGAGVETLLTGWHAKAQRAALSEGQIGNLESEVLAKLAARIDRAGPLLAALLPPATAAGEDGPRLAETCLTILGDALESWRQGGVRRPAETLLELELMCLIVEAWGRLCEFHSICNSYAAGNNG